MEHWRVFFKISQQEKGMHRGQRRDESVMDMYE